MKVSLAIIVLIALGLTARAEEAVPIGTIFSVDYTDVFAAMQFALEKQYNDSSHIIQLKMIADRINTVDAYKLTRIICRQVKYCLAGPNIMACMIQFIEVAW